MKQFKVKLPLINDIKDFTNIVSRHPYYIEAESGRYKVDAKSIMGLFSVDLSKPLLFKIHSDSENICNEVKEKIKEFIIEV